LSLTICASAVAQDYVLGNWEGTWGGGAIAAKIVPESAVLCRAFLTDEESGTTATVEGRKRGKEFVFTGEVTLGKGKKTAYTLNATAQQEDLSGRLTGGEHAGAITLTRVYKKSPTLGERPPAGAAVLFGGQNLDAWHPVPRWHVTADGTMELSSGNIVSKQEFGDAKIHVEFASPLKPSARGQGRGNSGVYVHGRYEIQVLDSFALEGLDNECGGIYRIAAPKVNMCLPPGEWQTYDITFQAPHFDASGKKTKNAMMTVLHNGVAIHENLDVPKVTAHGIGEEEGATGPLLLQDHDDKVNFRNVWVLPLD
jgi:hypothetical protein